MSTQVAIAGNLGGERRAEDRSDVRVVSRALAVAAWALVETVVRFALVSLLLFTLAIRLAIFALLFVSAPRVAELQAVGLDRFPAPPSESPGIATSESHP